ncbi:hypothetical protein SS31_20295 [Pluralibacter gergoviae]|nr:hypothetical protein SS31_20295 [Pluralibacter gergoviae]
MVFLLYPKKDILSLVADSPIITIIFILLFLFDNLKLFILIFSVITGLNIFEVAIVLNELYRIELHSINEKNMKMQLQLSVLMNNVFFLGFVFFE